MRAIGLAWLLIPLSLCAGSERSLTTPLRSADAYAQPYASITLPDDRARVQAGRILFKQVWTLSDGADQRFSGLGPLYNRFSCVACHPGNGRGFAPEGPAQTMKAMLVRLSVDDAGQGNLPHPVYGDQLQEFGVPGVAGEGIAQISYQTSSVQFADGETVTLRKPVLQFSELAYGPLQQVLTSARIAPAVFGLGLLDNIADTEILKQAARKKPAGIAGRPNIVWDIAQQKNVIGRFGWKANVPNLRQQIASAFHGDLGITSMLYPGPNCTAAQPICQSAVTSSVPELSAQQLDDIQYYLESLATPQPITPANQRGALLFSQAQCIACHTDQLRTGSQARLGLLNQRDIQPYTDLLLHDMVEGLADHRPDAQASGREWRTPPLWGIGLAQRVHPQAGFLHDGRARSVQEAILWHGGEAEAAKALYMSLDRADRQALLNFIDAL